MSRWHVPSLTSHRFIISTEVFSESVEQQIVKALQSKNVSWWHWIPGTWLLIDPHGQQTAESISKLITPLLPNGSWILVHTVDSVTNKNMAGQGPSSNEYDVFEWLLKNWIEKS